MRVSPEKSFSELPATVVLERDFPVSFLDILAVTWLFLTGVALPHAGGEDGSVEVLLLVGVIWLVCGTRLLLTANRWCTHGEVQINNLQVEFHGQNLFRTWRWTIPLNEYQGVLRYVGKIGSGGHRYSEYRVRLKHPDSDRVVDLYRSLDSTKARQCWEEYSRLLNLPALRFVDGELVSRDPADLDKSVLELERPLGLAKPSELAKSCPPEVQLESIGQYEILTFVRPDVPIFVPVIGAFLGVVTITVAVSSAAEPWVALAGLLFLAFFVGWYVWGWKTHHQLRFSREGVHFSRSGLGEDPLRLGMRYEQIEEIGVSKQQFGRVRIQFVSDTLEKSLTVRLPQESARWVRNYVLAKMAQRSGRRNRKGSALARGFTQKSAECRD